VLDLGDDAGKDAVIRLRSVRRSLHVGHQQVVRELVDPLRLKGDLCGSAGVKTKDATEGVVWGIVDDGELEGAVVDVGKRHAGMTRIVVLGARCATGRIDGLVEKRGIEDEEAELWVGQGVGVVDEADTEAVEGLLDGVAEEKTVSGTVEVVAWIEPKVGVEILSVGCMRPEVRRGAPVTVDGLVEDHASDVVGTLHATVVVVDERVLEVGALSWSARGTRPGELVPRQQTLHDLHHASHQPGVLAI